LSAWAAARAAELPVTPEPADPDVSLAGSVEKLLVTIGAERRGTCWTTWRVESDS
jgi:hypothetical protein